MPRFGFLGLGIMGRAMANNLLQAGFELMVWNRSPEKSEPLAAAGATVGSSPAEVVAACPITFAMLADPAAAEEVCFGSQGVLKGVARNSGYVDMSTVDDCTSRKISAALTERGARYLEAPVSGSKKPAEDGALVILAAGDQDLYRQALPAFDVMGKKTLYLGAAGQGARMKLVVNMIMGVMMAGFSEGLALAQKGGLDPRDLLEVLDAGALANPMFRIKGPTMLQNDYAVHFPLKHMQKDLRLSLETGDELGQPLFVAGAANESFKQARSMELGDADFSALFRAVLRAGGKSC